MKRVGIIGGLGPESTIDYYKRIISFFHQYNQSLATPELIIYSINLAEVFKLVGEQDWDALVSLLNAKIDALRDAGAEFAVISANTPHIVFDRVSALSPLPLISIVEVTLQAAKRMGLRKVGLLGTLFTMQANFFATTFARDGITVVVPSAADQQLIQKKLEEEIELGILKEETKQEFRGIIRRLHERDDIEAVILGCTELPLILQDADCDLPLLNTTALHVEAICAFCAGND